MKTSALLLSALFLIPLLLPAQSKKPKLKPDPNRKDWIQLFNGKNLDGWHPKIRGYAFDENFGNTFRVENGVMRVAYDGYTQFNEAYGHLFHEDKFSHYIVGVEYRFVGDQAPGSPGWANRNSGIMVHCQDPKTIRKDQDVPISLEVQLLGGLGKGKRTTANLCLPGTTVEVGGKPYTKPCLSSNSETFDGDQWVRAEVEVLGGKSVRHFINGKEVLSYERPRIGGPYVTGHDPAMKTDGKLLEEGYIALQSESHPMEFRKVELLNLTGCMNAKSKNFKSYFVNSDSSRCEGKAK